MAWTLTADPLRFDEAVRWFASRIPITEELLEQLSKTARSRAWTVAGVAQLDVVLLVWDLLRRAIEDGTPFNEFRKAVAPKLLQAWGQRSHRERGGYRIETLFRTNVQAAYNRGRWVQQTDPVVTRRRPYLMYDALLDSRTTRLCITLNATILLHDDPWWQSHLPPLHPRCRASLRSLTEAQAARRGLTLVPPSDAPVPGFGSTPEQESEWQPDFDKYPAELLELFARKQEDFP
ncbi:MAG: phage minor head protein [Polyangiaceae bacterium]